jgi:ubiquinone/menaquinone biosynthesis C-methylase UbiE
MPAPPSAERIRDVNVRYHDAAAGSYDSKWGIDFGPAGQAQVLMKLRKALGHPAGWYERSLEIGAGTGYFSLNLVQAGVVGTPTCTDISAGMLERLKANAATLGVEVETAVTEAEALPFPDDHFDLVLGHAVLHHLPDLAASFAEFARVLKPGGTVVFAGEPSRHGDKLAAVPKRAAHSLAPLWRRVVGAGPAPPHDGPGADGHALEGFVDVHAFTPGDLDRHATGAGLRDVRVSGEELLANWFGWANRALEATADPDDVPMVWRLYAYHGYLALQKVDTTLLETRLPAGLFYNLLVSARKPKAAGARKPRARQRAAA